MMNPYPEMIYNVVQNLILFPNCICLRVKVKVNQSDLNFHMVEHKMSVKKTYRLWVPLQLVLKFTFNLDLDRASYQWKQGPKSHRLH